MSSHPIRVFFSIIAILAIQLLICGQFPTRFFRIDLVLILPVYFGIGCPVLFSVIVSSILGLIMDVGCGGFIGFHMILYSTISLGVIILDQRIDVSSFTYQVIILGCASILEILFLSVIAIMYKQKLPAFVTFSNLLLYRTLLIMAVGPILLRLFFVAGGTDLGRVPNKTGYPGGN